MTGHISGPGIGLGLPQNLYPSELGNAPYDTPTNRVGLAPGASMVIPAGEWLIDLGQYCIVQYLDPVTNTWSMGPDAGWTGGTRFILSDGFNTRVANLTGCPISATVTTPGSNYVQASTTITAVPGNSTWLPIIGGALALSGGTLTSNGGGYGIPPIVLIPAPPPAANNANGIGGIPASGYCTITNGTVSAFSFTNVGAGYPTAPIAVVVPSPFDPNISIGITAATITFSLTNAGAVTGALCTNSGASLADPNASTLTVVGAGTGATLTMNCLQTVIAVTVTGAGTGYGSVSALLTTVGGVPTGGSILAPSSVGLSWRPRPAQVGLTVTAAANGSIAAQNGAIYDGGLFLTSAKPNYVIVTQPVTATTQAYVGATLTLTMGGRPDIVTLQPAA